MYANPALNVFMELCRYTTFTLSIIATATLLWLLIVRHPREFGNYKHLLLTFVAADLYYAFAHFSIVPVPEVYNDSFVMGGHGYWRSKLGMCMWMIAYSLSFPLLSYNFLYRFVAIKYPLRINIFTSNKVIAAMVLIVLLNASNWFCVSHFLWYNHHKHDHHIIDLFTIEKTSYMTHDIKEITNYIIIVFWENSTFTFSGFNFSGLLGGTSLAVVVELAYLTMFITAYQIYQHLEHKQTISDHSRQIHHQLFRALVYQAVLPFFTAYLPIYLCGMLPLFGWNIPLFSVICPPFCALHPVIDGVIMLTTIKQFRKTVYEVIAWPVRKITKTTTYTREPSIDIGSRIRRTLSDAYLVVENK